MADLVHNDKKHIAEYELDQRLPVFWSDEFEARLICERMHDCLEPRLK